MQQSTLDFYDQHQTPQIACGEQPQQRFEMFGAGALSDTELIAIMLHTGIRGHSVLGLASQLREAARALDIELLDHVVIGTPAADPTGLGYYSFRSAGLL